MGTSPKTAGERIRLFGETVYDSIKEYAQAIKMAPPNLQKYMNNEREPGSTVLRKLYGLGCNINWLLSGNGEMFADNEVGRMLQPKVNGAVLEPAGFYISGKGESGDYEFTLRIRVHGKRISITEVK